MIEVSAHHAPVPMTSTINATGTTRIKLNIGSGSAYCAPRLKNA
jgi:hypothetical protein